jgi:cell division protein ZapA
VAVVTLTINERLYEVGCDDGQAEHIRGLGQVLDDRSSQLSRQLGVQPEGRLLVMVGLMLVDELADIKAKLDRIGATATAIESGDARMAAGISQMVSRIEAIAEQLERA